VIGKTISHYKILEEIGSGGMSIVYKAEDFNLKRSIALKFLSPILTGVEETRKRFITEAQSASALDHPNICTIHEIDATDDGRMFIAMNFYEGETLNRKISRGPLDIPEAVNIAIQISQGLSKAHEKGIIHRDIKPGNIMITSDNVVKILDFGLAKLPDHTALTRTGTMLGTVAYMSPQQAGGEKVDHRTDIWSLGVILYEMLYGCPPFQGDNEQAMMYAILNKDPKPLIKVPEYIEKVIHKALIKDADKRYQDIQELIKDLKAKSAPDIELPAMENSIVVLPFKDFSENKENEYFSDGLTEEIITDLSKVKNLLVISRGSAMTFKDSDKKLKEIGKELNVQYALEGSVRKAGNDLRINVQLIDTKNDTHVWAEKYSGTIEDVFDIQEKVSRSIVDALQLKLTPEEEKKLAKRPIKNIQAYECYLRARQESWLFTPDALQRALGYLQTGLDIIGENAMLYAGMGYVHSQCLNMGIDMEVNIDKAREYAEKALQLDPESGEAHLALGLLSQILGGNERKSITHLRQALAINPGDAHAKAWLNVSLCNVGMMEKVRFIAEELKQIDPLTPMSRCGYGLLGLFEGNGDQAVEGFYEWFRLEPQNPAAVYYYALALVYAGRLKEATAIIDQHIHIDWADTFTKSSLMVKYAAEKDIQKIKKLVTGDFEKTVRNDLQTTYFVSVLYALAGFKEEAFELLEHAVNHGFINYPLMSEKDPLLETIRGEERFKKLMKQAKHEWETFDA
jgi:serine/threonine protein kinase/Flp pilus assembly protein TadD